MAASSFSPSLTDIVNQVLAEYGRGPVDNITTDAQAQLIANRVNFFLPIMLNEYNWNWAIKYVTDSTPLTQPFSPEWTFAFQLPFDYGHMFHFWNQVTWNDWTIIDNMILANQATINYYYVVVGVNFDVITANFMRALVLYVAESLSYVLTQDVALSQNLEAKFRRELARAIMQNDMERNVQAPPNDFDRWTWI
jgi:hypothetical protein